MSPAHRVGPTEDKLLAFLGRYLRATAAQCTRFAWSPNSLRFVRKRLAGLVAGGYLEAYTGFSRGGTPPLVYVPALHGWRYVERQHGLPTPPRWRPGEAERLDYGDYRHDLALTDFGIALERFCREADPVVRLIRFTHDRLLPQRSIALPDGGKHAFRPDGFFELRLTRDESGRVKQRCQLLEIDRGTHYDQAVRTKLIAQLAYVESGGYAADYGTRSVGYLWVCPDGAERARHLRQLAETVLRERQADAYGPLFAFTGANPATTDPVALFITPCWQTPFQAAPIALLTLPPPLALRPAPSQYLPPDQYERFLRATGGDASAVAAEHDLE